MFFKFKSLSSVPALALLAGLLPLSFAQATNPVSSLVGKYRIETCDINGFHGLEKVTTRIRSSETGHRVLRVLGDTVGDVSSSVRAHSVDWADSDTEGRGILFIDTKTGEALYIGGTRFG